MKLFKFFLFLQCFASPSQFLFIIFSFFVCRKLFLNLYSLSVFPSVHTIKIFPQNLNLEQQRSKTFQVFHLHAIYHCRTFLLLSFLAHFSFKFLATCLILYFNLFFLYTGLPLSHSSFFVFTKFSTGVLHTRQKWKKFILKRFSRVHFDLVLQRYLD